MLDTSDARHSLSSFGSFRRRCLRSLPVDHIIFGLLIFGIVFWKDRHDIAVHTIPCGTGSFLAEVRLTSRFSIAVEGGAESISDCCMACGADERCQGGFTFNAQDNTCIMHRNGVPVSTASCADCTSFIRFSVDHVEIHVDVVTRIHAKLFRSSNQLRAENHGTVSGSLSPVLIEDLKPGITLALHGDISRIDGMLLSGSHWKGPVVLSLLVYDADEAVSAEKKLNAALEGPIAFTLTWCMYLPPRMPYFGQDKEADPRLTTEWTYPSNILRNRALQLVGTKQVLLLDADFIPVNMGNLAKHGVEWLGKNKAIVLPPFVLDQSKRGTSKVVTKQDIAASALFQDKAHLQRCVEAGPGACGGLSVSPFPPYLGAQVNYKAWWTADKPYKTSYYKDAEPYFIGNTEDMRAFDERYVGYGGDRVEQFHRMMLLDVQLYISNDLYIVHAEIGAQRQEAESPVYVKDNRDKWKLNNFKLCGAKEGGDVCYFGGEVKGLRRSESVSYDSIYPAFILNASDNRLDWKLGKMSAECRANQAIWGNCRPTTLDTHAKVLVGR